ncbi:peptide-N-glycosidase F-related protein [Mangrovimonas aestuarii]|uniref:peptide-N-glycosidase F-related protein n=1 Tax=Mangrovimonas aestuarii TaxID=3018443 RepID=UPI0023782282|nr:peptide-N-glycosidase F-related protein [Mangrovimonas aestuarii]
MIKKFFLLTLFAVCSTLLYTGCSDDDAQKGIQAITISSDAEIIQVGGSFTFTVMADTEENVTDNSVFYIDGNAIQGNVYTPEQPGMLNVYAKLQVNGKEVESNELSLTVSEIPVTAITLTSDIMSAEVEGTFTFNVMGDNGSDVTSEATYYVNDETITGNVFTTDQLGTYIVKAVYNYEGTDLQSNEVQVEVLPQSTVATVYDEITFFGGYSATVSDPVPDGVIRLSNTSYVAKLTDSQIDNFSNHMDMEVVIKAACDNYDRIGKVNLHFMPKDVAYNSSSVVKKMEIGRFITPFMNKNYSPDEVPYIFNVDNLAVLFNDTSIRAAYDFWIEFNVFGTTGAGQQQVAGCAGSLETFKGSLRFISTVETYTHVPQYIEPISFFFQLKNYNSNNTDVLGETVKTFQFTLDETIDNAKIYLITSNHGANSGGEEYVRREHYVYMDGTQVDMYMPGGESCEPYRQYNTQGNGIYGSSPKSASWWAAWNNWCPGDKIPIRVYNLGTMTAGTHNFKIEVPDAEFVGGEGHIPVSVYIQGDIQ